MAREQVKLKKAAAPVEIGKGVLIRDGVRVLDDPWLWLDGEAPARERGDIIVPLARWLTEREAFQARTGGRLGVLLEPEDAAEMVGKDANQFALIAVRFPSFRDGRGFTTARLLRERYHFAGELRAVGDVIEDQIFFMQRCGFDAFELIAAEPEAAFARAARTFSAAYQPAADSFVPVYRRRAGG